MAAGRRATGGKFELLALEDEALRGPPHGRLALFEGVAPRSDQLDRIAAALDEESRSRRPTLIACVLTTLPRSRGSITPVGWAEHRS